MQPSIVFFTIVAGLTGRPYGMRRTLVFAATGVRGRGRMALLVLDTVAFLTFQVPVHAAILVLAGATWPQMLAALGLATFATLPFQPAVRRVPRPGAAMVWHGAEKDAMSGSMTGNPRTTPRRRR